MLQSIKQIYGDKLAATDREIGSVKDFYFEDTTWVIRDLVADTGAWMPGRLVLISPHAVSGLPQGGKIVSVNLTRNQIEKSPPIESHKPVSRQYEEEYYRFYGLSRYWQGDSLWGTSGFPLLSPQVEAFLRQEAAEPSGMESRNDPHLRSGRTVSDYEIRTRDERIGRIKDFLVDDKTWEIRNLVVSLGHWGSAKDVLILPSQVERISWDESTVFVNLTKEAILESPVYDDGSKLSNVKVGQ